MNTHFDPELSRLAFEDRLLEFCGDDAIPLLERVRMLAIIGDRLDVFFMTRVGRLKRLAASADERVATRAVESQRRVAAEAHRMMRRAYGLFRELVPALAEQGITLERWVDVDAADQDALQRACGERLGDAMRVVTVGESTATSFPHVRNLRPTLAAEANAPDGGSHVVIVELPADLPRLVRIPARGRRDAHRFMPIEELLAALLPRYRPRTRIDTAHLFRVTRNAATDFSAEDHVLESVEREIQWRPFQDVVRVEVDGAMPTSLRTVLMDELQREAGTPGPPLADHDLYCQDGLLDLTALHAIAELDRPRLALAPIPRRPARIDHLLHGDAPDVLLHFPFDDYETSLERLLLEAAKHPDLASLHTTIYRTDEGSDLVEALRIARRRGADVTAVVELKASFDEQENIDWARMLEGERVRVVLSPPDFKVHAKMALVTLHGARGPRRIACIGTGNMNALTARSYVDLWLVTTDATRTAEVAAVFETLVGGKPCDECKELLVSPFGMRQAFLDRIDRETEHARAGRNAGIRAMMNGLTDPAIIAALHRASQAGVRVDLVVRGVCVLAPGVPGVSENITVVSVAGHLLQHARIFHFANAGRDEWFIGSADWRPRNFDRRIEVVTSVTDQAHREALDRMLTSTLEAPDAWELCANGTYARRSANPTAPGDALRQ